jgi:hypothetical protein
MGDLTPRSRGPIGDSRRLSVRAAVQEKPSKPRPSPLSAALPIEPVVIVDESREQFGEELAAVNPAEGAGRHTRPRTLGGAVG